MTDEIKPRKQVWKKWWFWLIIILVIIVISSGGGEKKKETSNVEQPQEAQAIEVATQSFITEFDKNQLAAEEKYKDKIVKFTAVIKNISEDILGVPFLSLQPTSEQYYFGTNIKCSFSEKSQITALENGQSVTLQGTVKTQSLGIISIEDCKIVQ